MIPEWDKKMKNHSASAARARRGSSLESELMRGLSALEVCSGENISRHLQSWTESVKQDWTENETPSSTAVSDVYYKTRLMVP